LPAQLVEDSDDPLFHRVQYVSSGSGFREKVDFSITSVLKNAFKISGPEKKH